MANQDTSAFMTVVTTATNAISGLADAARATAGALTTVASISRGFDSMNAAVTALNKAAGAIPLPYLGTGASLGIQGLEAMRTVSDQMLNVGVGLGNYTKNLERISGLGVTPEKFQEILTKYPVAMGAAAPTAESRAALLERTFMQAKENQEAKKLLETSVTYNDTLLEAIAYHASFSSELTTSEEGLKELGYRAIATAKEWDENARITGQSRDQISQEARERMNNIKSQLFLNQVTEEQRAQYGRMLDMTKSLGPATQDLVETFARGGRLSKEQIQQLGALGSGGAMLENAVRAMMEAKDPRAKQAAEMQLEAAKLEISRVQSSKAYSDLVQQGKGPVAEAAATLAAQNLERATLAAQLRGMPAGTTLEEAKAAQELRVKREAAGYTAEGKVDPGQLLGREWSKTIQAGQTQLAAFFKLFDEKLIENIGGATTALKELREVSFGGDLTRAQQVERFERMPGEIEKATEKVFGPSPGIETGPAAAAPPTPPPGGSTTPVEETWFDVVKNFFGFNSGTYGVFGEWFNDFGAQGTFAKLHNNEAVVPFQDLSKFLSDTYESMPHLFQTIITDMESKKPTITPTGAGKTDMPFKFSEVNTTFEKIQQEQQKAFNIFQGMVKPSSREFTSANDVAANSFSTPRTKTVIKEPFNAADAMAAGLTGEMPRARTDAEDAEYKKWIIGGQVGPDPTRKTPAKPKEGKLVSPELQKILEEGEAGKAYEVTGPAAEELHEFMQAKKVTTKPKEGKLVSPELQKILEEGEAGKAYEVTGPAAEELHEFMQAKMGKIKTPESGRLPSMSDLATKMQEGMPKVEQGLSAAAKMVPEMAGMAAPGSLGDVVGMLGKLHGTMNKVAQSSAEMKNYSRTTAKYSKKNSGLLI